MKVSVLLISEIIVILLEIVGILFSTIRSAKTYNYTGRVNNNNENRLS